MARSAQELFQLYEAQRYEPILKGVRGTYLFDIHQAGCWFGSVVDGAVTSDEKRAEAECVVRCGEEDFVGIIEGRRNLLTSALPGRIQVRGDVAFAQKFHGLVSTTVERKRGGA
jgi:putative sterol carrier protein